jgi:hypothetical protein
MPTPNDAAGFKAKRSGQIDQWVGANTRKPNSDADAAI